MLPAGQSTGWNVPVSAREPKFPVDDGWLLLRIRCFATGAAEDVIGCGDDGSKQFRKGGSGLDHALHADVTRSAVSPKLLSDGNVPQQGVHAADMSHRVPDEVSTPVTPVQSPQCIPWVVQHPTGLPPVIGTLETATLPEWTASDVPAGDEGIDLGIGNKRPHPVCDSPTPKKPRAPAEDALLSIPQANSEILAPQSRAEIVGWAVGNLGLGVVASSDSLPNGLPTGGERQPPHAAGSSGASANDKQALTSEQLDDLLTFHPGVHGDEELPTLDDDVGALYSEHMPESLPAEVPNLSALAESARTPIAVARDGFSLGAAMEQNAVESKTVGSERQGPTNEGTMHLYQRTGMPNASDSRNVLCEKNTSGNWDQGVESGVGVGMELVNTERTVVNDPPAASVSAHQAPCPQVSAVDGLIPVGSGGHVGLSGSIGSVEGNRMFSTSVNPNEAQRTELGAAAIEDGKTQPVQTKEDIHLEKVKHVDSTGIVTKTESAPVQSVDFRKAIVEPMIDLLVDMLNQSGSASKVPDVVQSGDLPNEVWRRKEAMDLLEGRTKEEEWAAVISNMINASDRHARTIAQKLASNLRKLAEPHRFKHLDVEDVSPLFRAIMRPAVLKSLVAEIRGARVKGSSRQVLAYASETLQILDAVRALSYSAMPSKMLFSWSAEDNDPERDEKHEATLKLLSRLVRGDTKSANPKYIDDARSVVGKIVGRTISKKEKPRSSTPPTSSSGGSTRPIVFHDSKAHISTAKKESAGSRTQAPPGISSAVEDIGIVSGTGTKSVQRPSLYKPLTSLIPNLGRTDSSMVLSAKPNIDVIPISYDELEKKEYKPLPSGAVLQSKLSHQATPSYVKSAKKVSFADSSTGRILDGNSTPNPSRVVTIENLEDREPFDAGDPLDGGKNASFCNAVDHRMGTISRRNVIVLMQGVMRSIRERVHEQARASGTSALPRIDASYSVRDWRVPRGSS